MPSRPRLRPLAALISAPQRVLMLLVRGYRLVLSPWLGSSCRFAPTCSSYSLQALDAHGATVGTYLTLKRLAQCHPFCAGGHDPVPPAPPALFRRLFTVAPQAAGADLSPTSIDKTSP